MSLTHRLNAARNVFLAYARREECHPRRVARAVKLADAIETAIDKLDEQAKQILQLEIDMKTANENVKLALDALDAAEKTATDATQALADAKVNGLLSDENNARLAAKFPETVTPPPAEQA